MKIGPIDTIKLTDKTTLQCETSFNNCIFNDTNCEKIGDQLIKSKTIYSEDKTNIINNHILPQVIKTTRKDGITIEIGDTYKGDIDNDDNGKFIEINEQFNTINSYLEIVNTNGQKHKLSLIINGGSDLIDLRRQAQAVMEYLKELPSDILIKIAKFECLTVNPPLTKYDEFYETYLNDLNGNTEGISWGEISTEIFTSKVVLPPRNLNKNFEGTRDDGYNIKITDTGERTSKLHIKTPSGEEHEIQIRGIEAYTSEETYYRETLPLFTKLLQNLPQAVLEDFINEISVINLNNNYGGAAGQYFRGTNEITLSFNWQTDDEYRNNAVEETFVHEIGHAIDAASGIYATDTQKDFIAQFKEFKEIMKNFPTNEYAMDLNYNIYKLTIGELHSFEDAQEMFAALYNKSQTGTLAHLESLEKWLDAFKNSSAPNEKRAVELYKLLNEQVEKIIEERRSLPKTKRCDEELTNFVKTQISNEDFNNYATLVNNNLANYNPGLEYLDLIDLIFLKNDEFANTIKVLNSIINSDENSEQYSTEVKEAFEKLFIKLVEIRNNTKEYMTKHK